MHVTYRIELRAFRQKSYDEAALGLVQAFEIPLDTARQYVRAAPVVIRASAPAHEAEFYVVHLLGIGADVAVIEETSGVERVYRAGTNAPPKSELPDEVPDEVDAPPATARAKTPSGTVEAVPSDQEISVPDIAWPERPKLTLPELPQPGRPKGEKKAKQKSRSSTGKNAKKHLQRWQILAIVAALVVIGSLVMLLVLPDGPQPPDEDVAGSPGPGFSFIAD